MLVETLERAGLRAVKPDSWESEQQAARPEVINPYVPDGQARIRELGGVVDIAPFEGARRDLHELDSGLKSFLGGQGDVVGLARISLEEKYHLDGTKAARIARVFEKIAPDVAELAERASGLAATVEENARVIYSPWRGMVGYIGEEAHRLLSVSRYLGIAPLQTLDRLNNFRYVMIGGSEASSAAVELAPLVSTIHLWDDDTVSVPKIALVAGASYLDEGRYKARVVERTMRDKNPYGDFRGWVGRVVVRDSDKRPGYEDRTMAEVVDEKLTVVVDGADSTHVKTAVRDYIAENCPATYVQMTTGVGAWPYVSVEKPAEGGYYNQALTAMEMQALRRPPTDRHGSLTQVAQMVWQDFPIEHRVQFMLADLGLPFWAQAPICGRETGTIVAKLGITLAGMGELKCGTVHIDSTPTDLGFQYTQRDAEIVGDLGAIMFGIRPKIPGFGF